VLQRGYAVVTRVVDGKIVRDAHQAVAGADLQVRLASGRLEVRVQQSFMEET